MIEYDILRELLPKAQKNALTPELVEKMNQWNEDPLLLDSFKDNLISYTSILSTGKYKIPDYVNAVRFVSYSMLEYSDIDAYIIVFPERYRTLLDNGLVREDISPYVSAYRSGKLVTAIFEQSLIPSHVLNYPLRQKAFNALALVLTSSRSDIAKVNAANTILTHTKAPETAKIELELGLSSSVIEDYEFAMAAMVAKQLEYIAAGGDIKSIVNASIKRDNIIEVEVTE